MDADPLICPRQDCPIRCISALTEHERVLLIQREFEVPPQVGFFMLALARAKGEWVPTWWLLDNLPTARIRDEVQTCHIRQMAFRARERTGKDAIQSKYARGYRMTSELLIQRVLEIAREG